MGQHVARFCVGLASVLLLTAAAGAQTIAAHAGSEQPSFRRHIIPLLSRIGCSARECHGSFAGQGGFQLSLFGYDFEADHKEITEDTEGNEGVVRVNLNEPAKSLIAMK